MTPIFANSAWVAAPDCMIRRQGGWHRRLLQVRYGLFLHPKFGPTLIDTGYTRHSLDLPGRSMALQCYARVLAPQLVTQEQTEPLLAQFGLTPPDVSRVIVTHFHADHVSGLAAFPNARFFASGSTWAKTKQNTAWQNLRHGVFKELVPTDFDDRLDTIEQAPCKTAPHLPDGHDIFGDGSVLAIPLPGHADGHFGLLFEQREVPLLYGTDTQWVRDALLSEGRPRLLPRLISHSINHVAQSSDQVAAFAKAGGAVVLCHDDQPSPFDFAHGAVP
ncbi:MBL fold metallo-hydrolase [Sulfitobacter sp.]|uniref:MBL fold metallo-hydrolase n=1 Tax=Sulfitobacter sp. TaxID=1903071 RepID=UPI003299E2D6